MRNKSGQQMNYCKQAQIDKDVKDDDDDAMELKQLRK